MTRRVSRTAVSKLLADEKACERLAAKGRPPVLDRHSRAIAQGSVVRGRRGRPAAWSPSATVDRRGPGAVPAADRLPGDAAAARMRCARRFARSCPKGQAVAVAAGGATELLRLDPFTAWPYPSPDLDGAGPAVEDDVEEARSDLEKLIAKGAEYLVIPAPSSRWLEEQPLLRQYLESTYPHRPQRGRAGHGLFAAARRESLTPAPGPRRRSEPGSARAPRHPTRTAAGQTGGRRAR